MRRAAIQQLGRINDPRALALLQDVILQGDPQTLDYAVGYADRLGATAFGILLNALATGGEQTRESAGRTLAVLVDGPARARSRENLEALRRLRPEPTLIKTLGDRNVRVRAISPDDRELLRAGLVDLPSDSKAAERLLALGPDPGSVDVLERLVAEEPSGRAVTLTMLSTKGDPGRTAALARSLLPKSAEELAQMRGTFYSYDAGNWLAVVSTLETLQDREAVPILGSLLDWGADQELSARIARALVAVNDEASRRILVRALDSPHVMVRIAASGGVLSVYGSAR